MAPNCRRARLTSQFEFLAVSTSVLTVVLNKVMARPVPTACINLWPTRDAAGSILFSETPMLLRVNAK
jgi:hypothetical protein